MEISTTPVGFMKQLAESKMIVEELLHLRHSLILLSM